MNPILPSNETIALALTSVIGGPDECAEDWFRAQKISLQDNDLRCEFDHPLYQIEGILDNSDLIAVHRHLRCQLMSCRFHVRGVRFNCIRWRSKLPSDAHVLALFVRDGIVPNGSLDFDHVYGAFSYARFYCRDQTVYIMEIQSDVFGQLTSKNSRRLMRHWHRLTLMCVHAALRRIMTLPLDVYIPSSEYQMMRFPEISPFIAWRIYEQMPAQFDYKPVQYLGTKLEPVASPKAIGRAWCLRMEEGGLSELYNMFEDRVEIVRGNRYLKALDNLKGSRPPLP